MDDFAMQSLRIFFDYLQIFVPQHLLMNLEYATSEACSKTFPINIFFDRFAFYICILKCMLTAEIIYMIEILYLLIKFHNKLLGRLYILLILIFSREIY